MRNKTAITLSSLVLTFGIVVGVSAATDEPPTPEPDALVVEKPTEEPTPQATETTAEKVKPPALPTPEEVEERYGEVSPEPVVLPPDPLHIGEEDEGWDCRLMGNRTCGVLGSDGWWYNVVFDESGFPVDVNPQEW